MVSTIVFDGFAVDAAGWGWSEWFVVNVLFFEDCELEGAAGGLIGPGLSSTLAL